MHAHAHRLDATAPAPRPGRPALRAVPSPEPRRRLRAPAAGTVALYALGLVAGFLLSAAASAPGGADVVGGQLQLAGAAVVVGGLALLRARAVARRARRRGARA
ncbi:hypothetical protein [Miltoncostaea marina]|uniref:hypothetical protein n=1 Tax=Miltoncostaea marina TaxID=2843215 RepID=UPI001C3DF588|nr:hypothetical protein [Miltoncostaea marina]